MTLQDILNSNLSDKHKLELIAFMQKGGLTPDQKAGRAPIQDNGEEYYMNGDGEKIPSERLKKHPELRGQQQGKTITPTETITIGSKEYDVAVADTPELREEGLDPFGYLREDEGMLFVFDEPTTGYFTMKNCAIDLDIVFIDDKGAVISITTERAYSSKPVTCKDPYQFVLEVNANSGIRIGDQLDQDDDEFSDEDKNVMKRNRMLILDSNGDVQYKLVGGERIFSRIKTRQIIKAAIQAYKNDTDYDYRRVGRLVIKELDAQDSRDAEYVNMPE